LAQEHEEGKDVKIPAAASLVVLTFLSAGQALPAQQNSAWTLFPSRDQAPGATKTARGKEVFHNLCSACHGADIKNSSSGIGATMPGTDALAAKYKGAKPAPLEERTDLTPEFIKTFVRNGVSVMPFFRKTELSDADLEALSAYLTRNNKSPSH
jgi:mono/diheme cytochrome c family protein